MATLKRVGVLSVAKLYAVLMAAFGLLLGIFYAIIGAAFGALAGSAGLSTGLPAGLGVGFGLLAIIFLPIMYGFIGFISGAIGALLYNLIAKLIGGIEMEFEQ